MTGLERVRQPPLPAVPPSWKPCEEHGIARSQCWACSKPAGLCSYGLCGEPATHLTSGSRRCCEADARFLAQVNGGTVTAISGEGSTPATYKIGDEVKGKFCFENGDDVESRGRIIKIDHALSTPHYTIKTYDGRIAGAYAEDLFESEEG